MTIGPARNRQAIPEKSTLTLEARESTYGHDPKRFALLIPRPGLLSEAGPSKSSRAPGLPGAVPKPPGATRMNWVSVVVTLARPLRPGVTRIAACEFLAYLRIQTLPETGEVGGHLHRTL